MTQNMESPIMDWRSARFTQSLLSLRRANSRFQ